MTTEEHLSIATRNLELFMAELRTLRPELTALRKVAEAAEAEVVCNCGTQCGNWHCSDCPLKVCSDTAAALAEWRKIK